MADTSSRSLVGAVRVRRPHLWVIGAVLLAELFCLTVVVFSRRESELAQTLGDLAQLAAALLAVAGAVAAARRGGPARRAWAVLASSLGVWASALILWTWYGLTRGHAYPFPSLADIGFVGYALPAIVALFMFPRSAAHSSSRLRELLDASLIAGSVLFVGWATVLGPLYQSGGTGLSQFVRLAYPVVDIAVASVVLVLGTRVPPEQRRPWLLFGGGLVLLTVTDSGFVSLALQGRTGPTAPPLVIGWVAAMVLIAAASRIRPRRARPATFRDFTVIQELLPILTVAGAIAVAIARGLDVADTFLVDNAVVVLVLFAAQQVVTVVERVRLANGLEETIVRRTAELSSADARFRTLVESSDDAIVSATPDGVVTSWNAAAERLLGYSQEEIVGHSLDVLVPQDAQRESMDIRGRAVSHGAVRRSFETERRHKDGRLVPIALTASPIYDGDTVTGVSGILRDITDRLALQHEMEFRARHDTLTGLPNRELLVDRFGQALRADLNAGTRTGLLVIDLDRFKDVNDTFGYRCGDQLLRQVGPRLAGVLRECDTVARLGGDVFAVLLPHVHCADDASTVAFQVAAVLGTPFHVEGVDLDLEASIGVVISDDGQDANALLQHADIALDVAKTLSLGVFTYDPAAERNTPSKLELLGDLRRALDRGELVLHYQPKVSLSTGDVVGVEALVRWQHPERGLVFPDGFIPMAEHTALIGPLTQHVLDTALAQVRTWIDSGRLIPMAVNLSVRNLLDPHLPDQVARLLAAHGVPGALLELEVTESAIMTDPVRARHMLEQLSALGVRISIDDFGAGYTSLSQLTTLPVSELKIDRSFVMTMTSDPGTAMIVQSVIELGHNLGLTLVAEGVETKQTLVALAGLGCDVAQGYHLCRPIPAADFENWCAERASSVPDHARTMSQTPSSTGAEPVDGDAPARYYEGRR